MRQNSLSTVRGYPNMKFGQTAPNFSTLVVEFTSFSLGDRHAATSAAEPPFTNGARPNGSESVPLGGQKLSRCNLH